MEFGVRCTQPVKVAQKRTQHPVVGPPSLVRVRVRVRLRVTAKDCPPCRWLGLG